MKTPEAPRFTPEHARDCTLVLEVRLLQDIQRVHYVHAPVDPFMGEDEAADEAIRKAVAEHIATLPDTPSVVFPVTEAVLYAPLTRTRRTPLDRYLDYLTGFIIPKLYPGRLPWVPPDGERRVGITPDGDILFPLYWEDAVAASEVVGDALQAGIWPVDSVELREFRLLANQLVGWATRSGLLPRFPRLVWHAGHPMEVRGGR